MAASPEHLRDMPKSRDFLSVMSLVNPSVHINPDHISREHDNHNNLLSPMTSSSTGSLSPSSVSPRGNHGDDVPKHPGTPRCVSTKNPAQGFVRHNQVSTVMLHGVAIVCLFIDGRERLCLAQISNTLLKSYSYNEIHNRRVALGITCVQCTPVQLEILRRAGAMPISSRRCGMISKREAERLVKSFLEDTSPPKLPEDFAFSVQHDCGWGGRGEFIPSRYNSSRAKCLKCTFCNMYFSPNKFIFHFHRTPESKYNHPDAANFNSWRRHLKLCNDADDEVSHIWEDVKAMFNGGSRKRGLASHVSSSSSSSSHKSHSHSSSAPSNAKHMKFSPGDGSQPISQMRPRAPPHYPQYPVFPLPNKLMPFRPPHGHQPFCIQHPYPPFNKVIPASDPRLMKAPVSGWVGPPDPMIPPYEMIWAKHLGLSPMENGMVLEPRMKQHELENATELTRAEISPKSDVTTSDSSPEKDTVVVSDKVRLSAFRPVGNRTIVIQPNETEPRGTGRRSPPTHSDNDVDSEENVDVDTIDAEERDPEENNNISETKNSTDNENMDSLTMHGRCGENADPLTTHGRFMCPEVGVQPRGSPMMNYHESYERLEPGEIRAAGSRDASPFPIGDTLNGDIINYNTRTPYCEQSQENIHEIKSVHTAESDSRYNNIVKGVEGAVDDGRRTDALHALSKEELQTELITEMTTRRQLEADCKSIKETFQEQVEREKQFRDEMAKQLHIVREKLCKELEQERQVRFSLQQKLTEAHENMESISSQLKDSRSCSECQQYKEHLLPR